MIQIALLMALVLSGGAACNDDESLVDKLNEQIVILESKLKKTKTSLGPEHPLVKRCELELNVLVEKRSELQQAIEVRETDDNENQIASDKANLAVRMGDRLIELEFELQSLKSKFGADHPSVIEAQRNLDLVRAKLVQLRDDRPEDDRVANDTAEKDLIDRFAEAGIRGIGLRRLRGESHPAVRENRIEVERWQELLQAREGILDRQSSYLTNQLNEATIEYELASRRLGDGHPAVLTSREAVEFWRDLSESKATTNQAAKPFESASTIHIIEAYIDLRLRLGADHQETVQLQEQLKTITSEAIAAESTYFEAKLKSLLAERKVMRDELGSDYTESQLSAKRLTYYSHLVAGDLQYLMEN